MKFIIKNCPICNRSFKKDIKLAMLLFREGKCYETYCCARFYIHVDPYWKEIVYELDIKQYTVKYEINFGSYQPYQSEFKILSWSSSQEYEIVCKNNVEMPNFSIIDLDWIQNQIILC